MKKIITIMMVLAMVVALAVPALAADGVTKDEQELLNYFNGIVDKWAATKTGYSKQAEQYKAMAEATLARAELDAAACADLKATAGKVDEYIAGHIPTTEAGVKAFIDAVVAMVNETATKYEIVVAVNGTSELSQVWYKNEPIVITTTPTTNPGDKNPVVPQTGFDMTGTIVVAVVLAIALLGSAVVISKKRLAANN